ncbi:MAG: hypothetical protein K0V04_06830 [Deltaproteobacteria bacterium]|nr:hypothetical protein [Deltaproteobacteria bacterium]
MALVVVLSMLLGAEPAPEPGPDSSSAAQDTTAPTSEDGPSDEANPEPETADDQVSGSPEVPLTPEPPSLPEPPPTSVGEDTRDTAVRWSAPSGCPSSEALSRGVERRLGRTLSSEEVTVEATVTTGGSGRYRLALRTEVDGVSDQRSLEADDCSALADATALIVALAVDPVAVADALGAWRAPAPEDAPPVAVGPTVAPNESPRRGTRRGGDDGAPAGPSDQRAPVGGVFRASPGVGLGATPGVTGAFALAGGLRWSRARIELEGGYWLPRPSTAIDGASVRVQLGTVSARGCGQLGRDNIEAPLCGGLQVGGMRGDGNGAPNSRSAQGLWLALEAGVGLSWWFSPRWALAGGFVAAVPLVHPRFELAAETPQLLFEPASVAGRLWLGIEFRLNSP